MKTLKLIFVMMLASSPAFSSSINSVSWNSNYGSEAYTYTSGSYNYLYGYSYGTGSNNNWNEMEFYAYGSKGSMSGWAWDYFTNKSGTQFTELYGNLYNGTFNSKTDVFKALFSGYDYSYSYKTGQWSYVPYTGVFTEHLNGSPVNGQWSYGSLGKGSINNGSITTPEPGSLTLLGTGLVGLAGVVRRKLKV